MGWAQRANRAKRERDGDPPSVLDKFRPHEHGAQDVDSAPPVRRVVQPRGTRAALIAAMLTSVATLPRQVDRRPPLPPKLPRDL